jgi:hypothetical protein
MADANVKIPGAAGGSSVLETAARSLSGGDRTTAAIQKLGWALTLIVTAQSNLQPDVSSCRSSRPSRPAARS